MRIAAHNQLFFDNWDDCTQLQRIVRSLLVALVLCIGGISIADAATFTVTKTADTNDGTCNADCSLREAITDANGSGGNHTIAFNIPTSDPGFSGGVAIISPTVSLPAITRNNVTIDGTTQTSNVGNSNTAVLGAGGTVGVDALVLSQVAGPEVEIRDSASVLIGLQIQAINVTIRGLAILGYGDANGGAIVVDASASGTLIEDNVLGSTATTFADPGAALRNYYGVDSAGGVRGTVQNNLIGFGNTGVLLRVTSDSWTVEGNEIRDHSLGSTNGDGIAINDSDNNTIAENLITGSSSQALVVAASSSNNVINNTITNNGIGTAIAVPQSAGITLRSGVSATGFDRNVIQQNYGAGIQVNDGVTGTRLTLNSFADNGNVAARSTPTVTGQVGIDLNVSGDDADLGTPDFFSINTGVDSLQDFPILETASISGASLTLTGWSKPGAAIEVFIAAADPQGFGEGETYIGTFVEGSAVPVVDTDSSSSSYSGLINGLNQGGDTTNRFSFTVSLPAGVSSGTQLTSTATVGSETSEFSGVVTAAAVGDISGSVFEDLSGNVLNGAEAIGDAVNPVVAGVDVYLYLDDGGTPDSPDATDTIQNGGLPVVTNASGVFTFPGVANGTYWVAVDSRTVSPSAGVHPSYLTATPWAEQTFGPNQGWCADGSGGSIERVGVGPCYGGVDGANDDDATALASSEHIARVVMAGVGIADINFGFSYNVVSNVEAAGDASLTASTFQGSLDQFIRNANAINGANTMRFVPAVSTNGAGGGGAWWRVDYTGSIIGETLGNTHDADTSIDGSAFDLADGATLRNTNPGNLGANAGGGVTVGVDDVAIPQVARPEFEVMRSGSAVGDAFHFYSNALTGQIPNNFAVRDVATWGFVGGVGMTGTAGLRPSGVVIERNVIGSPPNGFADPAIPGTLRGVSLQTTDGATVRDNLIGFVDTNGVTASAVTGTSITGNEIRETGQVDGVADGINYGGTSTSGTITANLIVDSGGMGIDGTATANLIENNTVSGSGQLGVQIGGIRQTGSGNTVRRNIVTGSVGPGVIVPATVNANTVTENHFGVNGSIAIDLVAAGGGGATGDGVTRNDGTLDAADGNDGLDFPIIDSAVLSGGNLTVTGFARAGVTIEFYEAAGAANDNNAAGNPHGEGVAYLFTSIEGVADADPTTGASYTDPGYGADTSANRFSFTVAAPAGLVVGEEISPIAYLAANGTSEFGANAVVSVDADLVTTKVLDPSTPGPFAAGDAVTYLLTVTNNGPAQATSVIATETYPGELTLGAAVPSAPTTYDAGTGVWMIGTLNSGASATLTLPGTVNAGTAGDSVSNSVTAAVGDQNDSTATGDDLVETFTVLPFLSIDDVAQVETGAAPGTTTFTFTVSIDQAIGTDITFDIDTADNTATVADSDYIAISGGNGTLLAGETSTAIDVTVNGDTFIESDETFFVNLSNVIGAAIADAQGEGTINNDDAATVSIATATDANETGPVDGQFTVTQSTISATDTIITYSIAGTATATTDYAALTGSVTVPAGSITAIIDITGIVTDALVEGTETVIVTLTATDNAGITIAASSADTATVDILDADAATVSIATTTDANEAGPVDGQFTVTQSVTSATDTIITYSIAGTATATSDYTTLTGSVTVPAGSVTATINVSGIVTDALVEGTETVIVTLTGTDNVGITVATGPADTATVDILDADAATVSIATTADANETGPVDGQFTVTQSTTSATDTVISYTIAGTATATSDYTALTGSVTVPAGSTTATIDVTGIVADALVEGTETVVMTLTATDNPGIAVAASPTDTATISIIDADTANVSIASTTDANEAGPVDGEFTVTQSVTSASDTSISYSIAGTATAGGTDYTTLSGSVTIAAGSTTATIDVTGIVADALVEGSETVIVTLTGTDNPGIGVAASPADTSTIDIFDGNTANVSIVATTTANETGPVDGQFTVTQSATSAADTIITYTIAGTATATSDYTALTGLVTVPAGSVSATIDVTGIVADALVEGDETVIVTLIGTDDVAISVAASPGDTATVDILDANAATVSVSSIVDANEAGPVDGQFMVTQSTTSTSDAVVSYTVAGTATATTDYTALSGSVTVLAGDTAATIDVTGIVADALVEGNETVIVTLTATDNPGITVAASPNDTATVNILDDNNATVSIAATNNGNESGPIDGVFTVTQSAIALNDTVLSYTIAGTATGASDYSALIGTITIAGGATTATILVSVIDDVVAEGFDETVEVTLSSITASDPGISIAASPADTASLTIADNDSDLVTTKTVNNAAPSEGDSITYTLTVNNTTGIQATNVSLTDILPAGVAYVSDDSGGSYNSSTGIWSIGTLEAIAPNNIAMLNIMATVDVGASTLAQPITNTTTAAIGDQADPDTSTDVLSASITVDANSDLVTTKTVDDSSPVENATIVYTISVFNNGAAQATGVGLTDLLPTGVTYFGDDSGGAYNPLTGVWTIGTIDDGAIATLNISATVDTGAGSLAQPISNLTTAAIGDQPDPDTTTDDLTEDITVNYTADLVTTKTVDVSAPAPGDTIVYTLMAINNGPAPTTNVSLTDSLPAGVTYVSDDGAGAYDSVTGVWAIGNLADGAVASLNISASVDTGAGLLPQPITNTTTAAIGDQADADATGDDLVADIIVNLVDANLIRLTKTVGRDRANAGEIIAYSIEIRNTTPNPISVMSISDTPARGFKYVPGTAQLDGVSIPDPTIGLPLKFNVGTFPAFVDGNSNGVADPGEPGYAVLSYRLVAGSGVAPGIWTNIATATASCDACFVSNSASADIEIIEDTLFDLGTIIGKVFYDRDEDGWQDSDEAGIDAAMVVLDDGTYALTDEFGRYHFPAVKPGQRLLKINTNSLAGQAKSTSGKTRIVSVTPGLLAKANFGVIVETVDAAIGADGQLGIGVDSETSHPPLLVNGSTLMPSLLVNGEPVSFASADIRLGTQKIDDVVELADGNLTTPIKFSTRIDAAVPIKRWKLVVSGSQEEIAKTWKGKGSPPEIIEWDGVRKNGKLVNSGGIYSYYIELTTSDGQSVRSGERLFGVNRRNSISLNLAGGAFVSASHELTRNAKNLLSKTANAIRAYPDEVVVINGHTDSVGSEESNLALAERRARSAYDYLRKDEGLPEKQFVVQAFGEARPIANNNTAWGRELNRRVEISGDLNSIDRAKNYDPYRQPPIVRINSTDIEADASGTFRSKIDLESAQETMTVLLTTSQGRSVETVVRLPTLNVISPHGRVVIPIDGKTSSPTTIDTNTNQLLLHTELLGRTEPGNTVEFNGELVDVDAEGLFLAQLPLRTGENYYGLVARNPMGMLRIANLKLTLENESVQAPEFVVEPIPQLALQLPPPGIPMTNSNLVIPGSTVPGNRVFINDSEVAVDADGSFTAMVKLELGQNLLTARVVDQDGHSGQIEQNFEYNGDPMFFMALVEGTVSQMQTSGNLEAAGKTKRDETISEGRITYYLKGHVLGKYLLTSAFDSGQQELGELFSDLSAQDNDRLLTNLDPDSLYPVYGDNSTLVYDAQSQGKFYLALESETVTALIGNYALNFTDTELAGYQRTLYGASATYQSEAKDESGNSRTKAQAFYAKIEQAHVRDELRATGGSLYYLSQRGVIEGSEHVSVIVRDQDSELILRRTALQQGLDYSIDYMDGRLLTNRPISSFSADNSLIGSDLLGGSAVYLQIDYETVLDGFEQTATGARIRQRVGTRLALGVTSVDEDQLAGEYSLKAADAEYKLGNNSRLIAEYAASQGNNSAVNVSDDGGLTYQTTTAIAGSSGDAYKIAAELDVGEWFGHEDRMLVNTYFKHLDNGFSANSVTSEQGSEKSGLGASWKISDSNSLLGRYEKQSQLLDGSENTLATLQWNFVRNLWGVAAELEDRGGFAGDSTIAALRLSNRWTDTLSTTLVHQETLEGLENSQSTVGVAYRVSDKLSLDAKATHGSQGDSAQLGAQFNWRGNRLYVAQQINDLDQGGRSNNRLVGVDAPFGPDGAVYSEYHWSRLPLGRQKQAMLGARQRFQATDDLRIELSGEHSAENAGNNTGERYALAIGATFDNDGDITFSTRNEYRRDTRSIESEQFLSTTNLKMAVGDDLAVLGKYRFSKSKSSAQLNRNIDFTEASIGLAYRPVEHDRLNLLTRFTRLTNTPTEFQLASTATGVTSNIFAVDWSYQLSQRIEWVGKQAMRWSENDDDPLNLRSKTSLSIQRLNWSMRKQFRFGTEYRLMNQDIANDRRNGFATELMWEGLDPVVLGFGYNFSDVSDNEYVDYDFSTKGPFFRLQGKF